MSRIFENGLLDSTNSETDGELKNDLSLLDSSLLEAVGTGQSQSA